MKRFNVLLVLAAFLAVLWLAGCDSGNGGSGSGSATLVIENMSTYSDELILSLRWYNDDTGTSQIVRFPGGIAVRESKSISLVEGIYDIEIETNYDDSDGVYGIRFYAGSTITLVWNGDSLSKR